MNRDDHTEEISSAEHNSITTSATQQTAWYLERLVDKDKEGAIEITHYPFHIGRKDNCELQLLSKYISKYHALIIQEDNFIKIVDLGSVNGVFVNRIPIRGNILLKPGDVIHFNKLLDDNLAFRVISHKMSDNSTDTQENDGTMDYKKQVSRSLRQRKLTIEGKDFAFPIGLTLYLEFKEKKLNLIKTHLYGLEKEQFLIVNTEQFKEIELKPADKCIVRFSLDSKVLGFETTLQKFEDFPTPRLYLKYPKTISCIAYRKHTRYPTNLRAVVRNSFKDKRIPCKVVDISLGGCKVSFPSKLKPEIDGEVFLTFEHLINDIRVLKVHHKETDDAYEIGVQIISFGGTAKKEKYQEILDLHAPVKGK